MVDLREVYVSVCCCNVLVVFSVLTVSTLNDMSYGNCIYNFILYSNGMDGP